MNSAICTSPHCIGCLQGSFQNVLRLWLVYLLFVFSALTPQSTRGAQLLPGVYGYGLDRGENPAGFNTTLPVVRVTSRADTGPGSLRDAVDDVSATPIIVVFDVGGVINLESRLIVRRSNITIAGQTAPSPGVALHGAGIQVSGSNVLVQHLRVRAGDNFVPYTDTHNRDTVAVDGGASALIADVVFDHCTFMWSLDELGSVWNNYQDITFYRCLFAEPLNVSIHLDEGTFDVDGIPAPPTPNVVKNEPWQAENLANTLSGVTTSTLDSDDAALEKYQKVLNAGTNDYIEYTLPVFRGGARLDEHVVIAGITGTDRGKFIVEVWKASDPSGEPLQTSTEFDLYSTTEEQVEFVVDPTGPGFDVPANPSAETNYLVRLTVTGKHASSSGYNLGVDLVSLSQAHSMGPYVGSGKSGAGRLAFIGCILAHMRERAPWFGSKYFYFANNVAYNRAHRSVMVGNGAYWDDAIRAMFVGNTFLEGPNYGGTQAVFTAMEQPTGGTTLRVQDNYTDASVTVLGAGLSNNATDPTGPKPPGLQGFVPLLHQQAFEAALLYAGARPAERDAAERRVINDIAKAWTISDYQSRPGAIKNSVAAAGGWPSYPNSSDPWDEPDAPGSDPDGNGYTVIEEALHDRSAQVEGSIAEVVVHSEDFAGAAPALNWTPVVGSWSETSGYYAQTANDYPDLAVYNGGLWATDFSVSAALRTSWSGANNRIGLVYSYVDINNYSYVSFNTAGLVEVHRVTAGGAPQVIASGNYLGGGSGVPFDATVRRRGDTTAVLVNGTPCLPNVWEPGLAAGKVGFFTRFNASARFDDFTVAIVPASPVFDNFEDGDAAGWTATGGTWNVEISGSNHVYRQLDPAATAPFAILDESQSGDQSIVADVNIASLGTNGWVGLVVRYSDAANYYYAKISSSTAEIKKMVGGTFSGLSSVSFTPSAGTPYTVKFAVSGNTLALHINGVQKGASVTDDLLVAGKAGLLMYRADVRYDNVSSHPTP